MTDIPSSNVCTSTTHPLRIAELAAGPGDGEIGITFCPGKHARSYEGHRWQRDLVIDLRAIAEWRAVAVVTLIEDFEFSALAVPDLGARVRQLGMEWHHLPIHDGGIPDGHFEAAWSTVGARLLAHLTAGQRVLVHCRGGLGRAGMIAARLLIESGVTPAQAVSQVRHVRPGAIETRQQEEYVLGLARSASREIRG